MLSIEKVYKYFTTYKVLFFSTENEHDTGAPPPPPPCFSQPPQVWSAPPRSTPTSLINSRKSDQPPQDQALKSDQHFISADHWSASVNLRKSERYHRYLTIDDPSGEVEHIFICFVRYKILPRHIIRMQFRPFKYWINIIDDQNLWRWYKKQI